MGYLKDDLSLGTYPDFKILSRVRPVYIMGARPQNVKGWGIPSRELRSLDGQTVQASGVVSGNAASGGAVMTQINLKASLWYKLYFWIWYGLGAPNVADITNLYLITQPGSIAVFTAMVPNNGRLGPFVINGVTNVSLQTQGTASQTFLYSGKLLAVPVL